MCARVRCKFHCRRKITVQMIVRTYYKAQIFTSTHEAPRIMVTISLLCLGSQVEVPMWSMDGRFLQQVEHTEAQTMQTIWSHLPHVANYEF